MTKSADELEREVELTRTQMDRTVDAIGRKLTPGELLDEVVRGLRGSSGGALSSVGRQLREQPVPLALLGVGLVWVGAGLVWLAVGAGSRRQRYAAYEDYSDEYPSTLNQPGEDRYSAPVTGMGTGPAQDRGGLP